MTSPGRYPPPSGAYSRSSGDAATKGAVLIVVAVAIGVALLWWGGVGGDDSLVIEADQADDGDDTAEGDTAGADPAEGDADTTDAGDPAVTDTTPDTTPSVAAPTSTRPSNQVKVAVANGVGESGLAATRAGVLSTAGYVTAPYNAATSPSVLSTVYYLDGYENEALGVATQLGGDSALLRRAETPPADLLDLNDPSAVADFHVFVILGADRVLG